MDKASCHVLYNFIAEGYLFHVRLHKKAYLYISVSLFTVSQTLNGQLTRHNAWHCAREPERAYAQTVCCMLL